MHIIDFIHFIHFTPRFRSRDGKHATELVSVAPVHVNHTEDEELADMMLVPLIGR